MGKVASRQDQALVFWNTASLSSEAVFRFGMMRRMPWALYRQVVIALGVGAVLIFAGATAYFFFVYEAPSCADQVQNQDEEGVDCGGACALLCEAPNISVVWSRSVRVAPGVYHTAAHVRNPDTAAAGEVGYEVSLFDTENILVARREGEIFLAPGEIAPLLETNIVTGERVPARTFVEVTPRAFARAAREPAAITVSTFSFDPALLRLTAGLHNTTPESVRGVEVVAFLFDTSGTIVAASKTLVEEIPPRGRSDIFFTWQEPFALPSRIDITPRPLP